MNKRLFISFVLLSLSALLIGSVPWLEEKRLTIERLNDQTKNDLRELREIDQTNRWLTKNILPRIENQILENEAIELSMIAFYDQYASLYQFRVSKFVYYDTSAKMDIGFTFVPKNPSDIDRFLALRYLDGFIQIKELSYKEDRISGILTLIHPIKGGENATFGE